MDRSRQDIRSIVASHCGLANLDLIFWVHGSFNICIPVFIDQPRQPLPKMAFRVPLPYKVGEDFYPGNCEEKLRCEAATYIWIGKNCPDVPIPTLRGFGVSGGLSPRVLTPWQRLKCFVWRLFSRVCGRTAFCDYIPHMRTAFLDHGYTLIDWIEGEDEQILSDTFSPFHTETQMQNLHKSMAKIIISLAKVPQPRIGSWTISNDGQLSLPNRPLLRHLQQLENWNIPSGIARDTTYMSADTLYLDLLASHDNRLRFQGNAIFDENDACRQAADLVLMRATLPQFTDSSLRDGPNIFVDRDWNIRHIIDIEWACSLPLENLLVPYWLTGERRYRQFTDAIRKEETDSPLYYKNTVYSLALTMDRAWDQRHYWYLNALETPKSLFNIFEDHLQPFYEEPPEKNLHAAVSPFWVSEMRSFIGSRLNDLAQYVQEVRDIFNSDKSGEVYV
ncbi:hypothetical protein BDV59DRAFT_194291 [Aspergillus ambiguus]|uniref:uncharacterized protein n=1 Tax=Aspergillus ambiguus TaxID=176160 RepID=UPI003CCD8D1C